MACSGSEMRRGLSNKGEDRLVVSPELGLFAVFDGHNGPHTSDFAARELPLVLAKLLQQHERSEEGIKAALAAALQQTERLLDVNRIPGGSTACMALVSAAGAESGELVVVANVGDSRALAFVPDEQNKLVVTELSQLHHPSKPSERARIEAAGGRVMFDGLSHRLEGTLGLSRALGDREFKRYGLSAEPEFAVWKPSACSFLVLASDGLFDKLSLKKVCSIVEEHRNQSAQDVATELVNRGVRCDDISVAVLKWEQA